MTEQEYLAAGQEAWRNQQWQTAIDNFTRALELNPASPAATFLTMAHDIMGFYHKDRYNP